MAPSPPHDQQQAPDYQEAVATLPVEVAPPHDQQQAPDRQEAVATLPVEVAETETTTITTTTTTTTTLPFPAAAAEEKESESPQEDPLSPVVTLPSDDTNNSALTSPTTTITDNELDTDSVHMLQQQRVQVVEELLVVHQEEGDSSELLPTEVTLVDVDAAIVTEPVDDFDVGVDVDVDALGLGLGEAEEGIVGVEGVEGVEVCEGGEFVAMATKEEAKPSHTVTMPPSLPVDDVPPDDTITGDTLADKSIAEGVAGDEAGGGDDVVSKKVMEVTETTVTIVEETVTTVEEVVSGTGEVVSKSVTDTVKIDEVSTLNESVVTGTEEAMETEADVIAKKRLREDEAAVEANAEEVGEDGALVKRVKADVGGDAVNDVEMGEETEAKVAAVAPTKLGPKVFNSAVEMFTYFYDFLHAWNMNQNVNKYEFMVLSELIKQGNPQKEGVGITSFQVRCHPQWESRCYYLIRSDGSTDDFSYRKCVDKLMPLPESLFKSNGELDLQKLFPGQKPKHHNNQNGGRGGRGGDGGGRGGRGYGGRGGGGRFGRGGGGRGKGGRWGR